MAIMYDKRFIPKGNKSKPISYKAGQSCTQLSEFLSKNEQTEKTTNKK